MRAPERSSRVDRSRRAKALSFALRCAAARLRGAGGPRSTPKFFGKSAAAARWRRPPRRSAGLRRAHLRVLGFARGSIGVAAISHLTGGVESAAVTAGVALSAGESERFEGAADRVDLGLGVRQFVDRRDLAQRQRLEAKFRVGQRLQPVGPGKMRIFGPQEVDRVLLLVDEVARLHQLLGGVDRLVFDAVDIGRRTDQRGDRDACMKRHISFFSPVARGSRASASIASSIPRGGAPVRTPKRSLAERERGLASASASLGSIGWPRGTSNVGWASAGSPGKRREAARPRPERLAKNCLTMRSSSEWKVTTARRPPGLRSRSAAARPRTSSPSSSLTAMRRAWKARVAGWVSLAAPRRGDARDEPGKLERRGEGRRRPVGDDGARDAARGALLAEMKQDVGDRLFVLVAQDVGGRAPAAPPCACRGARRAGTKSRAPPRRAASTTRRCRARRRRQPRRRDASRPRRARRSALPTSRSRPPDEAAERRAGANGRRVAVDGDDPRAAIEKRARIAAGAERARRHRGRRRGARARRSPPQAGRERGRASAGAARLIAASPPARAPRARRATAGPAPAPPRDGPESAPAPRSGTCGPARRTPPRRRAPTPTSAAPRKKRGPPSRGAEISLMPRSAVAKASRAGE